MNFDTIINAVVALAPIVQAAVARARSKNGDIEPSPEEFETALRAEFYANIDAGLAEGAEWRRQHPDA